jgi:hypothetical protein
MRRTLGTSSVARILLVSLEDETSPKDFQVSKMLALATIRGIGQYVKYLFTRGVHGVFTVPDTAAARTIIEDGDSLCSKVFPKQIFADSGLT